MNCCSIKQRYINIILSNKQWDFSTSKDHPLSAFLSKFFNNFLITYSCFFE